MTEKRYETALFDDESINGYCVLDKNKPSTTARLHYKNVFISTKEGCDIVARLLNDKEYTINELAKSIRIYDDGYIDLNKKYKKVVDENEQLKQENEGLKSSNMEYEDIFGRLEEENERLKSALKELKEIGDYQTNHIKELQEELQPIQDICDKYKIPLEDLPDVLEEYITLDNEEYEEKLKERTI